MATPELVATVTLADIVLFGFMIVYYALTLNLHEQEKIRIGAGDGPAVGRTSSEDLRSPDGQRETDERIDVLASAASGSLFLFGCTLFGVASAVLGVLALNRMDGLGVWSVVLFVVFLLVVAFGIVAVGLQNFRANVRGARELSGQHRPLMAVLSRGLKKT